MNNQAKPFSQKIRDLGRFGDTGNETEEESQQHFYLISMGSLMSLGGILWGSICFYFHLFIPSLIPYGYTILTMLNLFFFGVTKKFIPVRFFQILISLLLPFMLQWALGGFVASGAVMVWSLLALVGSFTFSKLSSSLRWLTVYLLLTIFSGLIDPYLEKFRLPISNGIATLFIVMNLVTVSAIVIGLMLYLIKTLGDKSSDLQNTLEALQTTQSQQLLQSEKMASLGQLIASVAHEINTPIGAVKASGKNISDAIDKTLDNLPKLFRILNSQTRELFLKLISFSKGQTILLTSREERALIKQTTQKLDEHEIEDARNLAEILIQLGIQESIVSYLPLLRHPEKDFIFKTAKGIATIVNSTSNINSAVEKVSKIIYALKSFSHINQSDEMTRVDLKDGIEIVLTLYQNQLKQGIEIIRKYNEMPQVDCYPDELNQVWINLIHNAIQAMANKGILTISITQEENEALVTIADTGSGIPESIRSKIFDPFFTTKRAGEGSGLGLGIVKRIIDKHKGRIELKSEVGVGTEFLVFIPIRAFKI